MRLINTQTMLLEEFIGSNIPKYAILSHTWEKDEISLQELQHILDPSLANDQKAQSLRAKQGYTKVAKFVDIAASKGIAYAWADTCCIDKTSSADLSESINSMYLWYSKSVVCIAYIGDVTASQWPVRPFDTTVEVAESRWFTRGWTLQELLAPSNVEFYNRSWALIGYKYTHAENIARITGISSTFLSARNHSSAIVAEKMMWASKRETTREEDTAYCLLGLFDVNMPLLYGEGKKAFLRLQEHIAASSTDHSMFAWGLRDWNTLKSNYLSKKELILQKTPPQGANRRLHQNIFAQSPRDFMDCGDLQSITCAPPDAWTQTNRGFHTALPTFPVDIAVEILYARKIPEYVDDGDYLAILNCGGQWYRGEQNHDYFIGIWIAMIEPRQDGKNGFCRVTNHTAILWQPNVFELLNKYPKNLRTDLWMLRSKSREINPLHISKRFAGFLITGGLLNSNVRVHTSYNTVDPTIEQPEYQILIPNLPLDTSGGLVGVLTFERKPYQIYEGDNRFEDFAVIFGYPTTNLKIPFAAILESFDRANPLHQDLNQYSPFPMTQWENTWSTYYKYKSQSVYKYIRVTLATVMQNGEIFTELRLKGWIK
jgi:hypothetical protein